MITTYNQGTDYSNTSMITTYNQGTDNSDTSSLRSTTTGAEESGIRRIVPYAVSGAIGCLLVVAGIVITVVVSLLVKKSQQKSQKIEPNKSVGLLSYDNTLYDPSGRR